MMRLSDDKIEEIRYSVNIVEIIGSSVRLKKSGKNFTGLCPFHQEKTPSFMVNSEKQIYKCFGCGEGGNVFSFIMKDQNISFIEAVKQLAERSGIQLPRIQDDSKERHDLEKLYTLNEFAEEWYKNNLWKTEPGKKALDYLRKRGFRDDTLKVFGIGYVPEGWDGLVRASTAASFDRKLLEEAGLAISKTQKNSSYDRFRNRIIFPVRNQYGRTVGFGARKFDDSEGPKYINSPETPVYQKGRLLYGLYQNREAVRQRDMIIIVEGYTDVMALYEHGIGVGVATSGTALTPEQARLINRYTKNVVLLYDADAAGIKAALRGTEVLFGANLDVNVINLGQKNDPDSFLRENTIEDFNAKLEERQSIIEFYASGFKDKGKSLSYNQKTSRIRDMMDLIDNISDTLKRELMLKEIGEKLSTDEKTIFKEYYRKKRAGSRYKRTYEKPDTEKPAKNLLNELDPVEKSLGRILVNDPESTGDIISSIDKEDINSPVIVNLLGIVEKIFKAKKQYKPGDLINEGLDSDMQKLISGFALMPGIISKKEDAEQEFFSNEAESILAILKARHVDRDLEKLQEEMKNDKNSPKKSAELDKKYHDLMQIRKELTHLSRK